MNAYKTIKRNPFISRLVALLLTITLLLRIMWPVAMAESDIFLDSSSPNVNIYFGSTEIYDGMKINPTGYIHARYNFTSTRSELTGAEGTVILPKRLNAAYAMSEPIFGTDAKGNKIRVGKLTIDEELNVKVSFLDLLNSTGNEIDAGEDSSLEGEPEPDGEEDTDSVVATSGNTESGGGQVNYIFQPNLSLLSIAGGLDNDDTYSGAASPANTDSDDTGINPDEVITVEFDVPVVIDTTGLTTNKDGNYTVELESGGIIVKVTLVPSTPLASNLRSLLYNGKFDDPAVTITNKSVLKNGTPVTNYTTVYVSDTLALRYRFALSAAQLQSINSNRGPNNEYDIEIPTGLKIKPNATSAAKDMFVTINGTPIKYGVLRIEYNSGGFTGVDRAYVTFEGEFWDDGYYASITNFNGELSIDCMLDMEELGEGFGQTITFNDGTTITINVNDNEKHGVAKSTTGYNNATGVISWLITYTAGRGAVDLPNRIVLEDTFITNTSTLAPDNTYQNYIPGTVSVQLSSGSVVPVLDSDPSLKFYNTSGAEVVKPITTLNCANIAKVVYTVPDTINGVNVYPTTSGKTVKLTYQTQVTNAVYSTDTTAGTSIQNHVELKGIPATPGVSIGVDKVNGSRFIPATDKKWVSKIGTSDPDHQQIKWTVTVNTRGTGVTGLTLYDAIAKGLTLDTSTGTPTSLTIKGKNAADSTYTTITPNPTINNVTNLTGTNNPSTIDSSDLGASITASPTVISMLLPTLAGSPSNYYNTYEITYYTKVSDAYYVGQGGTGTSYTDSFENTVWVNFSWPNGVKPTGTNAFYAEAVKIGYDAKLLEKRAVECKYDSTNKYWYILWEVTVNPHGVEVQTGIIKDIVGDTALGSNNQYLSYILDSCEITTPKPFTASEGYTGRTPQIQYNSGTKELSVDVSGLGVRELIFEYRTKVDEKAFQSNTAMRFENEARVASAGVTYNSKPYTISDSARGNITPPSKVLDKKAIGTYDYDAHEITWKVTVNTNKIEMKGLATLTDTLANYLTVKSIEVKNQDTQEVYNSGYKVVDIKAYPLVIEFNAASNAENLCSKKTLEVTIVTGVDVNKNADFKEKSKVTIRNDVKLDWNDYGGIQKDMTAGDTLDITNTMLSKSRNGSGYNEAKNTVGFRVDVNPIELKLTGCTVEDWLPKELKLDITSVKLYEADVNSITGALSYTDADVRSNFVWSYDYNAASPVNVKNNNPPVKNNLLTVKIPDDGKAYVLIYECFVLDWPDNVSGTETTIRNDVDLTGLPNYDKKSVSANSYNINFYSLASALSAMQLRNSASITIKKVDALHKEYGIENIPFKLYAEGSAGQKVFITDGTTGTNGELTFNNLDPALKYSLVEEDSEATTGYKYETALVTSENGSPVDFSLDSYAFTINGGTHNLEITNLPASYPVAFKKVNEDGDLLTGSKFKITDTSSSFAVPYTDEATSVNGVVKFNNVPVGAGTEIRTYKLVETASTPNHLMEVDGNGNPIVYKLEIDSNGDYTITNTKTLDSWTGSKTLPSGLEVVNKYDPVSRSITTDVYFQKINDIFLSRLNGATFKITEGSSVNPYSPPTGHEPYTDVSTSTGNGIVTFRNVPVGLYELKEIASTPHYVDNGDVYILTVNRDKSFRIADKDGATLYDSTLPSAKNNPWELKNVYKYNSGAPPIPISFNKVRSGSNAGLSGAVFQIEEDPSYRLTPPDLYSGTATSASGGLVTFSNVHVGLYTLKEISAPPGCRMDDTEYMLIVYAGGTYRIVDPDGNTVYDSNDRTAYPGLWKVENVYTPSTYPSRSGGGGGSPSGPGIRRTGISLESPELHAPENTLRLSPDDENVFIEYDKDGNPIGEWRRTPNINGGWDWTYYEYSKDEDTMEPEDPKGANSFTGDHPNTGDSSRLFLWKLSFCASAAVLIALLWIRKRKTHNKKQE